MNAMTKFGLGLAALGRPGYINIGHAEDLEEDYSVAVMERRAHEVLEAAWGFGVRYFDCARSYGRAEEFVGNWILKKGIPHESISIGSKWGYTYTADWQVRTPAGVAHEVKNHELQVLKNQFLESAKRLGPHLKLYQIHSATPESGVLENSDILEGLLSLKQTGIQIGVSVSGPSQSATIDQAITIEFDGVRLFDSVQATWNLLEKSAGQSLQSAHDSGIKVIIKVDGLALAAVVAQPWVTTVLSGASTIEHLHSNLAAENVEWDDELEQQLRSLVEPADVYWRRRSKLEWN